ncbi:hypothetical protein [Methylobacterium sp. 092160098-2]|uniref:hypothetical protein n=1 Tax=Methylobacterium sp. 092160098-2 TaxID=3025129 RepID=UPI002381B511|nr:hypothetical protein [Methylobacterium sp. 092160098-2]MDE4914986.1 hypothetical protein [Methylobacterium sp. 092160098-2]
MRLLLATLAVSVALPLAPAMADDFGVRLCSAVSCSAEAEQAAIAPTWNALTAMGTDQLLGATFLDVSVGPAALVAGAIVVGPVEMDRVMRGGSMDPGLASVVKTAMGSVAGVDISAEIGKTDSSVQAASYDPNSTFAASSGSSTSGSPLSSIPGLSNLASSSSSPSSSGMSSSGTSSMNTDGDSPPGCDSRVSQMVVQAASKYVEDMDQISRSDMGFTRKDGRGAQPSYESEVGSKKPFMSNGSLGGLSCLSNLFSQAKVLDNLFRPPTMQSLMNQVQNLTCGAALSAIGQANQAISRSFFSTANMGGFFPGAFLNSMGGGLNGASGGGGLGGFQIPALTSIMGTSGSNYGTSSGQTNGGYGALFGRR